MMILFQFANFTENSSPPPPPGSNMSDAGGKQFLLWPLEDQKTVEDIARKRMRKVKDSFGLAFLRAHFRAAFSKVFVSKINVCVNLN
jgi:hypothetical protein